MAADNHSSPHAPGGQGQGSGQGQPQSHDLNIPAPKPAGPPGLNSPVPPPIPSPSQPPVPQPSPTAGPLSEGAPIGRDAGPDAVGVLTPNNAIIGAAIIFALTIVFFFVRGAIRSHLIAHKASPSAAGNAGWALLALLLSVSVTAVFGFLGRLWSVWSFTVPLGIVIVITSVLFIMLYSAATRIRR